MWPPYHATMNNDWTQVVSDRLCAHLTPGSKILIAVSGGPDSVALAHFLKGLSYRLVIGHVDHQLRRGSAAEARFVQKLAKEWDLPCLVARVQVRRYAARNKMGLEEAARELRYAALVRLARQAKCAAIVTAHHADDQAETVLMNFLRGAGPAGLAGIPERRRFAGVQTPFLLRPFLGVRRTEIESYLKQNHLPCRRDLSNASLRFARNRIRHAALPFLEKLYPGLAGRLVRGADIFREEEAFWQKVVSRELRKTARKSGKGTTVVLPRLLRYHKALSRRILRHILPGSSFQEIEQALALARSPGRADWLRLPGRRRVRREKNQLVIE